MINRRWYVLLLGLLIFSDVAASQSPDFLHPQQKGPFQANGLAYIEFPLAGAQSGFVDPVNLGSGYVVPTLDQTITEIQASGTNVVLITLQTGQVKNYTDNAYDPSYPFPYEGKPENITAFFRKVTGRGISCYVSPLSIVAGIIEGATTVSSRVQPSDPRAFMMQHIPRLVSLAQLAESMGCEYFQIFGDDTEQLVANPDLTDLWVQAIAQIRNVFSGKLLAESTFGHAFDLPPEIIRTVDIFGFSAHTYDGRYAQFYKAIKAKYPKLQAIATMPVNGMKPDVVDDHYYKREQGMFAEARHYDNADRNGPKIFVGEWATREGSPTPNFGAALGDAAFMTGLERNSDVVIMASYAPLFVNVNPGGMQWSSDLIGYDALSSYGSPSYYAQVMFSSCLGDHSVNSSLSAAVDRFFYSVTASPDKLCMKLVNASSTEQPLSLTFSGLGATSRRAQIATLKANTTWATNTITQPERIMPVKSTASIQSERLRHVMPGYSIEVVEVDLK